MLDAAGELIYVGKAKSLRTRLMSYFRTESREEKAGKIIGETRRLLWEPTTSEFDALLRELELIRRWQPRYNVQGQPRRQRRCYIVIGRRPAAYAFVSMKIPAKAVAVYGPVAGWYRAKDAVRRLNDWYRLRDCPDKQVMRFADQQELFPVIHPAGCLRHEIGNCLAPCAGVCTQKEYGFHVRGAMDFLEGKDTTPLEQLQRKMREASVAMEFERASLYRDRHDILQWVSRQLERLREAVKCSRIYRVTNHDQSESWYLIREGSVRCVVHEPTSDVERTQRRIEELYSGRCEGMPSLDEVDGVLLVDGWFRKHKAQREKLMTDQEAMQRLRASPKNES
jgi:excinuclease ABC subunit C